MANGLQPYYLLQSAFTGGEISAEVANRVDLDKYQFAVLRAKNCLVKPHGPIYRRPGMVYANRTKYNDKKSIVVGFNGTDNNDYLLEIGDKYIRIYKKAEYLGVEIITPYTESDLENLRFAQSADTMFITSGKYPVKQLARYSETDWRFSDFEITDMYFGESNSDAVITPSAVTGDITLTADKDVFTAQTLGASIKLRQEVASTTVSIAEATKEKGKLTSDSVKVGANWKIISHGTWTGTLTVEKSEDGTTWKKYREYTSKDDYNPSESGSLTEEKWLRAVADITSGTCKVDITAMPYTAEGIAKITAITSTTKASAHVEKELSNTDAATSFLWGAWSEALGYPQTICFFQDRLCFGGNSKQPYIVWMSRTGDYGNFSVEKASGTVTDDSAIAASFISRKQFKILHLVASTDLLVLTAGNEWTISGSDTVTPSKIVPKMQATRGCGDTEPLMIGNRIVFVQGRGSTVRDMAYSYETDSYDGNDLTLLAKHMVEEHKIIDACYKQEPDSTLYFVRDDGVVICLAYILDQKVYAWSTIETNGEVEAIAAVQEGEQDVIYIVVARTVNGKKVRNIEYLKNNPTRSTEPQDYIELDAAMSFESKTRSTAETTYSVPELAGCIVDVLGDGRAFTDLTVSEDGAVTLPAPVQQAIIGLPYTTVVELPNVEIKAGDGTMQGRKKQISNCVLRLQNSLGGSVGPDDNTLDILSYDETSVVSNVQLFTGDKEMVLPIGGFNNDGRLYIKTDSPYPFNLLAAVREVSFGG